MRGFHILLLCGLIFCFHYVEAVDISPNPAAVSGYFHDFMNTVKNVTQIVADLHALHYAVFARNGSVIATAATSHIVADALNTQFNIAEISQLITATAAMMAVESGALSLTDDIMQYLGNTPIGIPSYVVGHNGDNFVGQPHTHATMGITVGDLLTDTAGLGNYAEYTYMYPGGNPAAAEDATDFVRYFQTLAPFRIEQPRNFSAQTFDGFHLLAYVVETATGIGFCEYITMKIFQPLNMTNSSCMITDQIIASGKLQPNPSVRNPYVLPWAAAGMISTAGDLVKIASLHMNGGSYNGVQILSAASVELMQSLHFTNSPVLPGVGYGWKLGQTGNIPYIELIGTGLEGMSGYTGSVRLYTQYGLGIIMLATVGATGAVETFQLRVSLDGFQDLFIQSTPCDPAFGCARAFQYLCVCQQSVFTNITRVSPDSPLIGSYLKSTTAHTSWFKYNGYLRDVITYFYRPSDGLIGANQQHCVAQITPSLFSGAGAVSTDRVTCVFLYPVSLQNCVTFRVDPQYFGGVFHYNATFVLGQNLLYTPVPAVFRLYWQLVFGGLLFVFGATWIIIGANAVVVAVRTRQAAQRARAAIFAGIGSTPMQTLEKSLVTEETKKPVAKGTSTRRGGAGAQHSRGEPRWLVLTSVATMTLLFFIPLFNFLTMVSAIYHVQIDPPLQGQQAVLKSQLSLAVVAAVLLIPLVVMSVPVILYANWHGLAKLWLMIVLLVSSFFVLVLLQWNWFGPFFVH
eukprot:TRINITY_DN4122_c0_g3_i1.p1 TRINITY_DN4122_c0_g3~~TRINITY_DN4122_c0_g3_i1.p1  ORF type:complete len:742 (-),score=144.86 TRINITY_DN4122_c0_g3_i1:67-2292(-)